MDEFDIIRRYFLNRTMPPHVAAGPGDDCAVLSVPAGEALCVSTDTLIAGVHFPKDASGELVADRAFGANLSDLAAMGAAPHAVTIALTLAAVDEAWLEAFSTAADRWAVSHHMPIVGGNLARGELSVTLTVMGVLPTGTALLRSGANVDDDIYVTGTLGDAAGAVRQLGAAQRNPILFGRYACPSPRVELGQQLRGVASAAIDLSDGFLADLSHLLEASGVGAEIETERLPLSPALLETFVVDAPSIALKGGDDYELCFTAPCKQADRIMGLTTSCGVPITRVGRITAQGGIVAAVSGKPLTAEGYQHFK